MAYDERLRGDQGELGNIFWSKCVLWIYLGAIVCRDGETFNRRLNASSVRRLSWFSTPYYCSGIGCGYAAGCESKQPHCLD